MYWVGSALNVNKGLFFRMDFVSKQLWELIHIAPFMMEDIVLNALLDINLVASFAYQISPDIFIIILFDLINLFLKIYKLFCLNIFILKYFNYF